MKKKITKDKLIEILKRRPAVFQKEMVKELERNVTDIGNAIFALEEVEKELVADYRNAVRDRRSKMQKTRMAERKKAKEDKNG